MAKTFSPPADASLLVGSIDGKALFKTNVTRNSYALALAQ